MPWSFRAFLVSGPLRSIVRAVVKPSRLASVPGEFWCRKIVSCSGIPPFDMLRAGSRHAQGRLKPFDKLRTGCAELEGLGAGGFGFSLETAAVDLGVDLGTVDADLAGSLDP